MSEDHPHPLLAQVPLTVSPFLSLPIATPLPYTYKSLPSTLPPSAISPDNAMETSEPPRYIVSEISGHSAHPNDIISSCRKLQDHLQRMQEDSQRALMRWESDIQERDLAEKRRVAPGWLDVAESGRGLVPERAGGTEASSSQSTGEQSAIAANNASAVQSGPTDQGAELDKAFGGLSVM